MHDFVATMSVPPFLFCFSLCLLSLHRPSVVSSTAASFNFNFPLLPFPPPHQRPAYWLDMGENSGPWRSSRGVAFAVSPKWLISGFSPLAQSSSRKPSPLCYPPSSARRCARRRCQGIGAGAGWGEKAANRITSRSLHVRLRCHGRL